MKRFINIFAFTLLIFILMLTFMSCNSTGESDNSTSDGTSVTETKEALQKFIMTKENASSFTIIRPEKCGTNTINAASTLFQKLNRLGFSISIKDDWVRNEADIPKDSLEILIGATNRAESREIYSGLKIDDYMITANGNRLVIIGGSDAATQKAVEYFIKTYLTKESDSLSFDAGSIASYVGEYVLSDVILCENSISKYDIVIPKEADHITKHAANLISQKISETCGYRLEVCEEGKSVKGAHITLSYSADGMPEDEYAFQKDNDGISIKAGKRTLLYSVREFISSLSRSSGNTADITPSFEQKKMVLSAPPLPSSLVGKAPVALCDQKNAQAVVIDLAASDPTSKEAILWEWKPNTQNGFSGTGFGNRIDEIKLRYSEVLDKYIICSMSSSGFIGIAEYPSGQKIWEVYAKGQNPHSIDYLPNGLVACALSTGGDAVRIYACDSDGKILSKSVSDAFEGAHAVHWDNEFGILWAMGTREIIAYEISGTPQEPVMTRIEGFGINIGSGGHDFSVDPNDCGLFWYSTTSVNVFDKYTNSTVKNYAGRNVINSNAVKCICEFPDGRVLRTVATNVYASHDTDTLAVFTPNASGSYDKTQYVFDGRAFYKARVFLLH